MSRAMRQTRRWKLSEDAMNPQRHRSAQTPFMRAAFAVAALGLTPAALNACDHDHDDDHDHGTPVAIRFAAKVGNEDFACTKSYAAVGGGAGVTLEPLDFRLYVHDVRLVDAAGGEWPVTLTDDDLWQTDTVALLDFEDKTGTCANGTAPTNTVVKGTYDTGHDTVDFTGLRLKVGVPFAQNHGDAATAPSPLNLSGLFWSWQGGYKFMRVDMKFADMEAGTGGPHGEGTGLQVHLGSTGCALDLTTQSVGNCTAPNRPEIELSGFDLASDTVVIDYAAIVAGVDLAMDMGGAPGCMSGQDDPECAAIFAHLGLDLATGTAKAGQTAFRLE